MRLLDAYKRLRRFVVTKPFFATDDVKIGKNVQFGRNVVFDCKKVRIGDGTIIQSNTRVVCDVFEIGDYGNIHPYCFLPGGELRIGHNFWLGPSSIVDSRGGTTIGNNVGIGAQSQLWTHIAFGDVMYGCRFNGAKPLTIGDDAWLVGHCLVSPVTIHPRSMAMLGSVVTKDMLENRIYAGSPAKDITDKLGSQFEVTSVQSRREYLQARIDEFAVGQKIDNMSQFARIVDSPEEIPGVDSTTTVFNVADRTYIKRGTDLECRLMRFLLTYAKFTPSQ